MSAHYLEFTAGNSLRSGVVFTPAAGTVNSVDDVSLRYVNLRTREWTTCTGIVRDLVNRFHCDFFIPDNAAGGIHQLRWESNSPAPHIIVENETTKFVVNESNVPYP